MADIFLHHQNGGKADFLSLRRYFWLQQETGFDFHDGDLVTFQQAIEGMATAQLTVQPSAAAKHCPLLMFLFCQPCCFVFPPSHPFALAHLLSEVPRRNDAR